MRHHLNQRRGFTLIELLVTMGLIVVLLSIAVAVSNSSAVDSYKLVGSADKVAQALITSKSRALRDKAPRGIRFNVGTDGFIRELVFIESGDPWLPDQTEYLEQPAGTVNPPTPPTAITPNRSQFVVRYQVVPGTTGTYPKPQATNCHAYLILNNEPASGPSTTRVQTRTNTTQRGDNDYQRFLNEVSVGDTVYSPDLGAGVVVNSKAIATGVNQLDPAEIPTPNANWVVIDLGVTSMTSPDLAAGFSNLSDPNPNFQRRGTFQTTQFGIHRAPRPIAGEPSLLLAKNVAIDYDASLGTSGAPQSFDILFSPTGQVINVSQGIVALTVRDTFKFTPQNPASFPTNRNWLTDAGVGVTNFRGAGEMVLVAIYPKTGTVATKPVAEPTGGADPYKFAKDAINSGL